MRGASRPSGVAKASAGNDHFVFIKTDGSVWVAGRNQWGQLGDGTTTNRNSPMQILSSGAVDVSCGSFCTLIRMSDGSMRGMGKDNDGQLGLGRAVKHTSPVQVATGMPAP